MKFDISREWIEKKSKLEEEEIGIAFSNFFLKQNTLYIIAGVAGAGKSTYAAKLAQEINAKIVSSDQCRLEICGNEEDQSANNYIFQDIIPHKIGEVLVWGNCIYDATNCSSFSRKMPIRIAKQFGAKAECHYFKVDTEKAIRQNEQRTRNVPISVIYKQARNWEMPTLEEGFDFVKEIINL